MGRDGRNLPERPTGRPPADREQPDSGYASPRSEDGPLSGPWDTSPRSEDAPLPGPWELERTVGATDEPQSPLEWDNEPRQPLPAAVAERAARPRGNVDAPAPQRRQVARRRHRYASNPLAAALHSKNALMGSIIIGDVLNSRGGRKKRKLGQF